MRLPGTDKSLVQLAELSSQGLAFLGELLLAPGQSGPKLLGLGLIDLPLSRQPFQFGELGGEFVVALTEFLSELVAPQVRGIKGLGVLGNVLFELVALGLNAAELILSLANLFSESVAPLPERH